MEIDDRRVRETYVFSASGILAQAKAFHAAGDLLGAERLCRRVIQGDPANSEAYYLLAVGCHALGRDNEAIASLNEAIRLNPQHAEAHNHLGALLAKQGNLDEAILSFERAQRLLPGSAEISDNLRHARALASDGLGQQLASQEKLSEAAACYRQALELAPDLAETLNNLGSVLVRQQKLDDAVDSFRRALRLKPDFAEAHNNLGIALDRQGDADGAVGSYQRALQLKPDYAEPYNNLGNLLHKPGSLEVAMACYRRAIALKPEYAEAHLNHAFALLATGRFLEGWSEYEWRWLHWKQAGAPEPNFAQPRWAGTPLAGRTILLHCEPMGYGDTLQFVRYASVLKRQGASVVIDCPEPLRRLVGHSDCAEVASAGQALKFDVYAPLMSLPGILGTTLDSIPADVPYLAPDENSVQAWNRELGQERRLKIGATWQGNPSHRFDRLRSFAAAQFAGIARMPGVRLFSLQKSAGREQLRQWPGPLPITDLCDRLHDFHETAAVMRSLDLVITCDSALAHLAGALGVSVWVALPFSPDWRWLLERTDSPWYPTMRLFRQQAPGDWDGVFRRIQEALTKMVADRAVDKDNR